ncbi:MAG: RNA-binding protein, partial [Proteobacteria bacterium]|nr:RNA-binding protein [Pseudomonadota bacterium]
MSSNIYVGNLSYDTTDDSLSAAFSQYGSVLSARVITDRMTGRSRGFGFVEM